MPRLVCVLTNCKHNTKNVCMSSEIVQFGFADKRVSRKRLSCSNYAPRVTPEQRRVVCFSCHGTGIARNSITGAKCKACKGKGKIRDKRVKIKKKKATVKGNK